MKNSETKKPKIDKNSLPEGFSVKLALVDALPVIFFSVAFILLGVLLKSITFIVGASICLVSGSIKVLWKIIVAVKKKNVWWMFVQMRVAMPAGFLLMLIAFIVCACTKDLSSLFLSFHHVSCLIFAILGCLGVVCMIVFSIKLDPSDVKSNWIEQLCNSFAQLCFALCVLLAILL